MRIYVTAIDCIAGVANADDRFSLKSLQRSMQTLRGFGETGRSRKLATERDRPLKRPAMIRSQLSIVGLKLIWAVVYTISAPVYTIDAFAYIVLFYGQHVPLYIQFVLL